MTAPAHFYHAQLASTRLPDEKPHNEFVRVPCSRCDETALAHKKRDPSLAVVCWPCVIKAEL